MSGAEADVDVAREDVAGKTRLLRPRILIIQEKGRHAANAEFRESLCVQRAFARLGLDSTIWGLRQDNFHSPYEEIEKSHDAVLLLENYPETDWLPELARSRKLKIFWSIDSHVVLEGHLAMCARQRIDLVLNSIWDHVPAFRRHGGVYFPNAYPDELVHPFPVKRKIDVGFCGNILNRESWLEKIRRRSFWGLKFRFQVDEFVLGQEMVRAINAYRIHFNRNHSIDVNYRTFETLGCRTFLLTNETPGLRELFRIGTDLVTYRDEKDLLDKITHYLRHPEERETIARLGHEHARRHHTYEVRMKMLLDLLKTRL